MKISGTKGRHLEAECFLKSPIYILLHLFSQICSSLNCCGHYMLFSLLSACSSAVCVDLSQPGMKVIMSMPVWLHDRDTTTIMINTIKPIKSGYMMTSQSQFRVRTRSIILTLLQTLSTTKVETRQEAAAKQKPNKSRRESNPQHRLQLPCWWRPTFTSFCHSSNNINN